MILHFLIDEKIADQIISNFESVSDQNTFLLFSTPPPKHILGNSTKIDLFNFEKQDINEVVERIRPDGIILHAYHLEFAKALLQIERDVKIAWVAWGFDIYGLPRIKPHTYAPLTDSYLKKKGVFLSIGRFILASDFLRKTLYRSMNREDRYTLIMNSQKKVDYFTTYLEEDYRYFSRYYPNDMDFVECAFTNIDQYLGGNKDLSIQKDASNLIIGNSNTPESNHLDVLVKLKSHDHGSPKVFVPLSYGENKRYKATVLEKGENLFGNNFRPLLEFMERKDYLEILKTCSTGIFYHYRQQAMGNIIALLFMGARIYMYKNSPVYKYLLRQNLAIYDFDNDYKIHGNKALPQELADSNRMVLNKLFSKEKVRDDLKNLINLMTAKDNSD